MRKVIIFGNSGAGKSTLAKKLSGSEGLHHFDLDTVAWLATSPPQIKPVAESMQAVQEFITQYDQWVIEGCYADLLELVAPQCNEMIFLNLSIESCIHNARNRPWEPHKYPSKSAQDENLEMLLQWIAGYETRQDTFSKASHQKLYESYAGPKEMYVENPK